jgi:NADH-quinone oxidoreductase subunit A
MPTVVGYLLLFVLVGFGFIFVHLIAGKLIRPSRPEPEKLTIYECGEPTVGSAWVQFDLRYYVIALLFVIFDVEVAFFFPWAVVFGKANALATPALTLEERTQITAELLPVAADSAPAADPLQALLARRDQLLRQRQELLAAFSSGNQAQALAIGQIDEQLKELEPHLAAAAARNQQAARQTGWFAFIDIIVFFGVLLVGFAYLWKRGDINWVRSIAAEQQRAGETDSPMARPAAQMAGTGPS